MWRSHMTSTHLGRNERRNKQGLSKKAISLSADLERIAVLKRCGLNNLGATSTAEALGTVITPTADSASSPPLRATQPARSRQYRAVPATLRVARGLAMIAIACS